MGSYRIYFKSNDHRIVGRDDFEADGDAEAAEIAEVVYKVCSDRCRYYELWQGIRRVDDERRARSPLKALDEILEARQGMAIALEVSIRDSHWAIASSKQLLMSLQAVAPKIQSLG